MFDIDQRATFAEFSLAPFKTCTITLDEAEQTNRPENGKGPHCSRCLDHIELADLYLCIKFGKIIGSIGVNKLNTACADGIGDIQPGQHSSGIL